MTGTNTKWQSSLREYQLMALWSACIEVFDTQPLSTSNANNDLTRQTQNHDCWPCTNVLCLCVDFFSICALEIAWNINWCIVDICRYIQMITKWQRRLCLRLRYVFLLRILFTNPFITWWQTFAKNCARFHWQRGNMPESVNVRASDSRIVWTRYRNTVVTMFFLLLTCIRFCLFLFLMSQTKIQRLRHAMIKVQFKSTAKVRIKQRYFNVYCVSSSFRFFFLFFLCFLSTNSLSGVCDYFVFSLAI